MEGKEWKKAEWVEEMGGMFDEAVGRGDMESARYVISLVKDIDADAAQALTDDFLDLPISAFL